MRKCSWMMLTSYPESLNGCRPTEGLKSHASTVLQQARICSHSAFFLRAALLLRARAGNVGSTLCLARSYAPINHRLRKGARNI